MALKKVKTIFYDTYLAVIRNSQNARLWQTNWAYVDGQKKDILKRGVLSCAFFVSSILVIFGLIKEVHATVDGTIKDLKKFGWYRTKKLKPGAVLIWEANQESNFHTHNGFYLGNNRAISNNCVKRCPVIHHFTYGVKKGQPNRKIIASYWHRKIK